MQLDGKGQKAHWDEIKKARRKKPQVGLIHKKQELEPPKYVPNRKNLNPNKNYNRSPYSFANINLLGACNARCLFCLGKDLPQLNQQNQLGLYFEQWKNYDKFIEACKDNGINRVYVTGQNTDALQYRYLGPLLEDLHERGFGRVGIRTNGILAHKMTTEIFMCDSVGFSIHTLNYATMRKIMGTGRMPDWDYWLSMPGYATRPDVRVSIVVTTHNEAEIPDLLEFLAAYPIKYIQLRRVSTETRMEEMLPHQQAYDRVASNLAWHFGVVGKFEGADVLRIYGKEVTLWPTVKTNVNSINYFTDGTLSSQYFVIEGYAKENGIAI